MVKNELNSHKIDIGFDAWQRHSDDPVSLIQISLKPGELIDNHINTERLIFYIISGSGKLWIDNSSFQLGEGDSILVKENLSRKWLNDGSEVLTLLAFKFKPDIQG